VNTQLLLISSAANPHVRWLLVRFLPLRVHVVDSSLATQLNPNMSVSAVRFHASVMSKMVLRCKIGPLIRSVLAYKKSDGKSTHKLEVKHVSFSCAPKSAHRAAPRPQNAGVSALLYAIKWTNAPTKHVIT
jgi:hypothetical protein